MVLSSDSIVRAPRSLHAVQFFISCSRASAPIARQFISYRLQRVIVLVLREPLLEYLDDSIIVLFASRRFLRRSLINAQAFTPLLRLSSRLFLARPLLPLST